MHAVVSTSAQSLILSPGSIENVMASFISNEFPHTWYMEHSSDTNMPSSLVIRGVATSTKMEQKCMGSDKTCPISTTIINSTKQTILCKYSINEAVPSTHVIDVHITPTYYIQTFDDHTSHFFLTQMITQCHFIRPATHTATHWLRRTRTPSVYTRFACDLQI